METKVYFIPRDATIISSTSKFTINKYLDDMTNFAKSVPVDINLPYLPGGPTGPTGPNGPTGPTGTEIKTRR